MPMEITAPLQLFPVLKDTTMAFWEELLRALFIFCTRCDRVIDWCMVVMRVLMLLFGIIL